MRYALILNPVAGRGKALNLLAKICAWAEQNGVDFEFFSTTKPGDGYEIGRQCLLDRFDRVIVVGGDGSINEVGSAILGSDIVMGVIPGGSGNDFFKMIGSNGRLKTALKIAFFGESQTIDVGCMNGRPFFNSVGIGFDAEVALRASQSNGISGFLVYLSAVFKSWRNLKSIELDLEFDGFKFSENVTLVCIGNGRSSGGGFYLTPHAHFDDGLFDICLIEALPKAKIFKYLPKTLNGSHVRLPGVRIYRSGKIVIKSLRKFPVHFDGEPLTGPVDIVELKMDPRQLRVAVAGKP